MPDVALLKLKPRHKHEKQIYQAYKQNIPINQIVKRYGCIKATVYRIIKRLGHKHTWRYYCLGLYRSCIKCPVTQGNHVEYGWVTLIWDNPQGMPTKFKTSTGKIIKMSTRSQR